MINAVFKKSGNVNDYNPTKPVSLRPDFNSIKITKLDVTCFINYPHTPTLFFGRVYIAAFAILLFYQHQSAFQKDNFYIKKLKPVGWEQGKHMIQSPSPPSGQMSLEVKLGKIKCMS